MFFGADPNQPGTLRFNLFRFPVSIHWSFWIIPLIWGSSGFGGDPVEQTRYLFIWVLVFFVSIMGHELGHALAYRKYGGKAQIIIHGMGGMAVSQGSYTRRQKIIITIGGPAVGFMMAAVSFFLISIINPETFNKYVLTFLGMMVWINSIWSALNLLPVYPLDGGQLLGHIMHERKPVLRGKIGGITAAIAGLLLFIKLNSIFAAIMFGFLAYQNFQAAERARRGYW